MTSLPASGVGLDVGSTTVKLVGVSGGEVVFRAYERHRGRVVETALALVEAARRQVSDGPLVVTGSAGEPLATRLGGAFIHEVHAVSAAAQAVVPGVRTIIELGGQDSKMIHLDGGLAATEMNERCAAGTGTVIDRCAFRLGVDEAALRRLELGDEPLPVVSARCGVFAETDLIALVKAGQPADVALRALLEAIVRQNLLSLARGRPLRGPVVLLGGPNAFLPALVSAWRRHLAARWSEHRVEPAEVVVPADAQLFAAIGALRSLDAVEQLRRARGRSSRLQARPGPAMTWSDDVRAGSVTEAREGRGGAAKSDVKVVPEPLRVGVAGIGVRTVPGGAPDGSARRVLIGLDAGSTTVKAVAIDEGDTVVASAYRRATGNVFEDAARVLGDLSSQLGPRADVRGLGVTGYAADLLGPVLEADCAEVETLAHARSARRFVPDADVVCDVGGQDIKVLMLDEHGVRDFRLSHQCAAGNGALLEATAAALDVPLERLAEVTATAQRAPRFSVGCAVFLDTERVTAQRDGLSAAEILAGMTDALPRNIWDNVVAAKSLPALGDVFVLSGGVQRNAAAVEAQARFITARHPQASVWVHPWPGEAGAIGAALAAGEATSTRPTRFGGFEAVNALRVATTSTEATRCRACPSHCARTLVTAECSGVTRALVTGNACERGAELTTHGASAANDAQPMADAAEVAGGAAWAMSAGPLSDVGNSAGVAEVAPAPGSTGHVMATAVRPALAPPLPVRAPPARHEPRGLNLARLEATRLFRRHHPVRVVSRAGLGLRVAIPRVLAQYRAAPLFTHYLEALGVSRDDLVISELTSEALWRRAAGRGTAEACYPAKVAQAHVADLLAKREHRPFDVLFFPAVTHAVTAVRGCVDTASCPVVAGTPLVTKMAFGADEAGVLPGGARLLTPALVLPRRAALSEGLFEAWRRVLPSLTREEHEAALAEGIAGQRAWDRQLEEWGTRLLRETTEQRRCAVVLLGRPYHADPGLHHDLGSDLASLGRSAMTLRALPHSADLLASVGCASPHDLSDVSFLTNSGDGERLAAARFIGQHPFLVGIELSAFKCGQDASLYGHVAAAARGAHDKPFLALHDLDETKPVASLRLRVRTFLDAVEQWERRLSRRVHRAGPGLAEVRP